MASITLYSYSSKGGVSEMNEVTNWGLDVYALKKDKRCMGNIRMIFLYPICSVLGHVPNWKFVDSTIWLKEE